MRQIYLYLNKKFICFVLFFNIIAPVRIHAQCGSSTPSYTADLTGNPDSAWVSPSIVRADTCCGSSAPDKCLKFTIFLDPNAMGINFNVVSGALPPGALFYQINCGPPIAVGAPICLSGAGPHILTFCKPGNNNNIYGITSIPKPAIPDSILVRNGCSSTLAVSGFSVPTITWTSVSPGLPGAFNSYLNCTTGCATVITTPTGTAPPFVDYLVGGFAASPCQANYYADTVRVYFYIDLLAPLAPTTICFGSISAVLSPSPTGGLAPYTYSWSTGSTSPSITVGAGTYTLILYDQTGCPPDTSIVTVSQFTLPITANPGPGQVVCKTPPPTVNLSGTIGIASGGIWSGGTGTFSPSNTLLVTSYIPTTAEVNAGSVQLVLTSTGNQGCPPGTGTTTVTFQNPPLVSAGVDVTVCANNNATPLFGSITGFSTNTIWTTSGSGTFGSVINAITSYTPSLADIATGSVNVILTSTNNGACPASIDLAKITITPKPIVNAGPDQLICSIHSAPLSGTVSGPTTTGTWTTLGDGSFAPSASVLNASYTPGTNDITTGTVSLILTSSNNGNCLPEKDTVRITITKVAVPLAGLNQAICSNANGILLTGTVTGGTNTGIWGTAGSGAFNPINTALATSYSITPADITAGSVIFTLSSTNNGPCPVQIDTVKMTIREIATASAGINQVLCSSQNTISLSGIITGIAGTGNWTASGGGAFVPNNSSLNTSYSISATDVSNGSVTFTLTSTNNGVCPARSDTVKMKIIQQATANAGLNQAICSNTNILLAGTVTGGTNTGVWGTTGSGAFSPNNAALSASYSITAADIAAGSVIFTLSSTNNNPCPAHSDTVKITIREIATANAGLNQVFCSTQNTISLNGIITGVAGTGSWTASGGGSFIPGHNSLSTSYSISSADLTNGFVTFTLTSTNNGVCPARTDTVRMKIVRQPTVNAGPNHSFCSGTASVTLTGSISGGSTTGSWTTNGSGGFNPGPTSFTTIYNITPADELAGILIFTLSSTNNGPCAIHQDTSMVSILIMPNVNAGISQTICSSQNVIQLNGSVTGASGTGTWAASGTGSFLPNNSSLSTTYSFTSSDITNGVVTLTLTSTNNGVCPVKKDSLKINITKLAVVNAGTDQSICSTQSSIALSGTVNGGGNTGTWISSSGGSFLPGPNQLNTNYLVSATDVINGNVFLTLQSANSSPCPEIKDTVRVGIATLAIVNAGLNQVICSSSNTLSLTGNVSVGSGGVWIAANNGTFSPSHTHLNTSYSLTPADIANGAAIFTLSSSNNGACPVIYDTVKVVIKKVADVNAGPDKNICSTQPNIIPGAVITGVTTTGTWATSGTGSFLPGPNTVSSSYVVSPGDINSGTVLLTLTSTNNDVCPPVSDTLKISIIRNPQIVLKLDTTICEKQNPFRVDAQLSGGSGIFQWVSTGTGIFTPNNASMPTNYHFTASDVSTGSVVIGLNSINNGPCGNKSASMNIQILPSAKALFTASSYTVFLPADPIVFTNQSANATTYKWNFGDGGTSTLGNPTHKYTTVGYYTVTLIANNSYGCKDTADQVLTIISDVQFPNAFTPNPAGSNGGAYNIKDYSNDVFFPYTAGVVEYDLMIFNRWGELIFRTSDINTGWDGYFNGKLCQQDAYVWKANVKFFDGRTYNKTGSVTLLR